MVEGKSLLGGQSLSNAFEQETIVPDLNSEIEIDVEAEVKVEDEAEVKVEAEADVMNGKHRLEFECGGEEEGELDGQWQGPGGLRKSTKVCDAEMRLSRVQFNRLSLPRSNVVGHSHNQLVSDQADVDRLINPIGRDMTLNCLIRCQRADYGSIASLNRSFRCLIKSGEIYKLRRQQNVVEHWVYFSYRLLEWVAFDPVRRHWMQLPRLTSSECFMCSDKESLAVGTELLVLGKDIFSHVVYKYSMLTNSWTSEMTMNHPRCLFGSASIGEIGIFAGGCDLNGHIVSYAELYNSENKTWVTLPNMIKPRKMCSGIFMDGKFYVIGGIGGSDNRVLTCGEEFDLSTKTWREIPNMCPGNRVADPNGMPSRAESPPLLAVVNNQLYAADHDDMVVKQYNKETQKWATIGKLPERVGSMNGWGIAFRACGERILVIGGPRGQGEGIIEINSWVPNEYPPQWELLATKRSESFIYNCAVMSC